MGFFLMIVLAGGVVLGLVVDAVLALAVLLLMRGRSLAWSDAAVFLAATLVLSAVVHFLPYGAVRPGSDYDVAALNLFLQGLGYTLAPGAGALVAAMLARLRPRPAAAA